MKCNRLAFCGCFTPPSTILPSVSSTQYLSVCDRRDAYSPRVLHSEAEADSTPCGHAMYTNTPSDDTDSEVVKEQSVKDRRESSEASVA